MSIRGPRIEGFLLLLCNMIQMSFMDQLFLLVCNNVLYVWAQLIQVMKNR